VVCLTKPLGNSLESIMSVSVSREGWFSSVCGRGRRYLYTLPMAAQQVQGCDLDAPTKTPYQADVASIETEAVQLHGSFPWEGVVVSAAYMKSLRRPGQECTAENLNSLKAGLLANASKYQIVPLQSSRLSI
jgi:hypothetical protein